MKKNYFVVAVMLMAHSAFAQNTSQLAHDYTMIKNALVHSDNKAATFNIKVFQQNIAKGPNFVLKTDLIRATDELGKGTALEQRRAAFNKVSTTVWETLKKGAKIPVPVYLQYCPMKKVYWISMTKEIQNPYYGSAMLACGKTVETH